MKFFAPIAAVEIAKYREALRIITRYIENVEPEDLVRAKAMLVILRQTARYRLEAPDYAPEGYNQAVFGEDS